MKLGVQAGLFARMILAFAGVSVVLYQYPQGMLVILRPFVQLVTAWSCPYLDQIEMAMDGRMIEVTGMIQVAMTMSDGSMVPEVSGSWEKQVDTTLHLMVIAFTVFVAPALTWRRRLRALPITVLAVLLVCSFQLAMEIQATALKVIGESWLQTLSLAMNEANQAYFQSMESWYHGVLWIQSILNGGGALFLAVLAGFIGPIVQGSTYLPDPSNPDDARLGGLEKPAANR